MNGGRERQRHKAGVETSGRMSDIPNEKYKRNMGQLDLRRNKIAVLEKGT